MKMTVEDLLNKIILDSICGPGGDPMWENLMAAACAWQALVQMELTPKHPDLKPALRGGNVFNNDFLAEAEKL